MVDEFSNENAVMWIQPLTRVSRQVSPSFFKPVDVVEHVEQSDHITTQCVEQPGSLTVTHKHTHAEEGLT